MHSTYWINFYFTLLQLVLKDVKNQKRLQAEVNLGNIPTVILFKKNIWKHKVSILVLEKIAKPHAHILLHDCSST